MDVLRAGLVASVVSGVPSGVVTMARGEDLLDGARAAGAIVLRGERHGTAALLVAAVPVHLALSLGWTAVLARVLPPERPVVWGAAAGVAIAALDLGVVGRRIPAIRALPQARQWADHVAFGVAASVALRSERG
jgi:hypothetical protein